MWGRGAIDDKGPLIGLFEALESLIAEGFTPQRGIWLVSGFDEEVTGKRGAFAIAELLRARRQHFAWVLDEGSGIGEGVITALAVGSILAVRPDLVYGARSVLEKRELVVRTRPEAAAA